MAGKAGGGKDAEPMRDIWLAWWPLVVLAAGLYVLILVIRSVG